jgi:hypothetical protein
MTDMELECSACKGTGTTIDNSTTNEVGMSIDRIKRTALGQAWLAEFVRLVWESLTPGGRDRLGFAMCAADPPSGQTVRMYVGALSGRVWRREDARLSAAGLLGERVPVMTLRCRIGQGRWLTPLGVEVHVYGRRARRGER